MISEPLVSIVIVVWNNYPDTQECLNSLMRLNYLNYKIIVVDNGSTDNSGLLVKKNYYDIIVLQNNENIGYTGGCNTGLSYACYEMDADYCLILNNDTVIRDPNFLDTLTKTAEQHKEAGIVAPIVYDYADSNSIQSAGAQVNLFMGRARPIVEVNTNIIRSDAVHGCAFLVKRETIEDVGMLDDQFYLYWEEIDYCLRVKQAGYQILITPETSILHKSSRTIGGRGSTYTYYFFRNRLLLMRKHGRVYHWLFLISLLPLYALIHVFKSVREGNNFWEVGTMIKKAWQDFRRGNFGRMKNA
jgi:GT2 family glycosyltransferase